MPEVVHGPLLPCRLPHQRPHGMAPRDVLMPPADKALVERQPLVPPHCHAVAPSPPPGAVFAPCLDAPLRRRLGIHRPLTDRLTHLRLQLVDASDQAPPVLLGQPHAFLQMLGQGEYLRVHLYHHVPCRARERQVEPPGLLKGRLVQGLILDDDLPLGMEGLQPPGNPVQIAPADRVSLAERDQDANEHVSSAISFLPGAGDRVPPPPLAVPAKCCSRLRCSSRCPASPSCWR